MANGTRTLAVVLALVVGLAAGWLIGHGKPEPTSGPPATPVPTAVVHPAATPVPTPVCQPGVAAATSPKNWKLTVGPDPCKITDDDNGQPVTLSNISKSKGHKIVFKPSSVQNSLAIIFHVPRDHPKPFKNLAFNGNDAQGLVKWLLYCDDAHKPCSTGPALGDAQYGCYKYDQILDGEVCDASIIIQP